MKCKNVGPPCVLPDYGNTVVQMNDVIELPDEVAEKLRGHRFWEVESADKPVKPPKKEKANG